MYEVSIILLVSDSMVVQVHLVVASSCVHACMEGSRKRPWHWSMKSRDEKSLRCGRIMWLTKAWCKHMVVWSCEMCSKHNGKGYKVHAKGKVAEARAAGQAWRHNKSWRGNRRAGNAHRRHEKWRFRWYKRSGDESTDNATMAASNCASTNFAAKKLQLPSVTS